MSFERSWHAHYAPGVPREMDFEKITLPEALTRSAQRFPERVALVFMGKPITYRQLEAMVNRFAKALTQIGVKAGDRVAMLLPNMPQLVIANYAAFRIGAVPVPNNPMCTEDELLHQLNDSGSTVLVALDLRLPLALELKGKTGIRSIIACHISDFLPFPGNKLIPLLHKGLHLKIPQGPGMYDFLPLLNQHPDTPVENAARWDETGAILYTSGTTGTGKGVIMTHANISCNTQQLRAWLPETKDGQESILAVFPFFHTTGWTAMQNLAILAGWTDILVPRPDPNVVVEILKKFKPTLLPGPPEIFNALLDRETFRKMDLSAVKAFIAGAAPLPAKTVKRLKALKEAPVIDLYGLAELGTIGTAIPCGGTEKPGTVGIPLPGTDLKIVDAQTGTRELSAGETGEICLRGPQVMKGYSGAPREGETTLKDGWLHTGDLGFLDADGYLTLVACKKDMITAGDSRFYLSEVDEHLFAHPKILDACAIGVPDGEQGEAVEAYVVIKPWETAEPGPIIAYCREALTPAIVPRQIEIVEALPKNVVGRTLRRELRELNQQKRREKA